MSYQQDKFKEIADEIREYTGTSEKIAPINFASKIYDVYEAGRAAGGGGETLPDADVMEFPLADGSIGRVSTDSQHYDEIARTIQDLSGGRGKSSYKPNELPDGVRDVSGYQYEDGYYFGYTDGEENGWNDGYDVGHTDGEARGRQAQNEEFWRKYQGAMIPGDDGYGTGQAGRSFAGSAWNSTTFYPMFDIKPRNGEGMFYYFSFGVNPQISLHDRLEELGIELDTSKMDSLAYMFYQANIDDIPTISAEGATIQLVNVFYRCKTSRIREFIVTENNTFSTPFSGCTSLVDIKVSGTIGNNGFDMSPCTKLSRNSILSVLQTCNKNNAAVTVTLPKNCIDGTTETETYIANDTELNTALTNARLKGYTVSFD